jgi:hypothetical protein
MPAAVVKLPRIDSVVARTRPGSPLQDPRSRDIVEELRHARTQQYLQSQYPGRERFTELPRREWSPWPSAFDEE